MSKTIYLDSESDLTAQDLHSLEHCDSWISMLSDRIAALKKIRSPTRTESTALFFRTRALEEVTKRRAHLVRVSTSQSQRQNRFGNP